MKRTAKHATETIASILAAILAAILTTAALAGCGARGEGTFEPDPRTSTACKGVPCRDRTGRIHRPPNHEGHEMRIDFNSKDGVFAIKAENKEEKTQLKTSAVAICNLIIDFFDGEVQEMKAAKE